MSNDAFQHVIVLFGGFQVFPPNLSVAARHRPPQGAQFFIIDSGSLCQASVAESDQAPAWERGAFHDHLPTGHAAFRFD
jgi:hypothetical protein